MYFSKYMNFSIQQKCKRCNTTENNMKTNKMMSTKTVQELMLHTYMTNFDLFTFWGCKEIIAQ